MTFKEKPNTIVGTCETIIGTCELDCPLCNKHHEVKIVEIQEYAVHKGVGVEYAAERMYCDKSETHPEPCFFTTKEQSEKNLRRIQFSYFLKTGKTGGIQ